MNDDGTGAAHPVTGLDDVVHQRVRLGILTIAHEARRVEFGFLRTQLELTAGNLSQHLGVLETAGLVEVEKGYAGKRGRTWITLTPAARRARRGDRAAQAAHRPRRDHERPVATAGILLSQRPATDGRPPVLPAARRCPPAEQRRLHDTTTGRPRTPVPPWRDHGRARRRAHRAARLRGPGWRGHVAAGPPRPVLPGPTGPFPVGTVPLHLVDRSRPDPVAGPGRHRELMVSVWYPARDVARFPRAPWLPDAPMSALLTHNEFPADAAVAPFTAGHVGAPVRRPVTGCRSWCSRTARTATAPSTRSWSRNWPATGTSWSPWTTPTTRTSSSPTAGSNRPRDGDFARRPRLRRRHPVRPGLHRGPRRRAQPRRRPPAAAGRAARRARPASHRHVRLVEGRDGHRPGHGQTGAYGPG